MNKSLFEVVRELIDAYDASNNELTETLARSINALRPYLFGYEDLRKRYAQVEPFPKTESLWTNPQS